MEKNYFQLMLKEANKNQLKKIMESSDKMAKFNLQLTEEDAKLLVEARNESLKRNGRVELSGGILPLLIEHFCDSPYIQQDNYTETLQELQELFYAYKNESMDLLSDLELVTFMKEKFDGICAGSIEYLGGTCLEAFARDLRENGLQ